MFTRDWSDLRALVGVLALIVTVTARPQPAVALSAGPNYAQVVSSSTDITNASNALGVENNLCAQSSPANPMAAGTLVVTKFGFNIPSDAIIDGILADAKHGITGDAAGGSIQVYLTVDGSTSTGVNEFFNFAYVVTDCSGTQFDDAMDQAGGPTDKWGTAIGASTVNSDNFGLFIQPFANNLIDAVWITIYYHTPAPSPTPTATATATRTQTATATFTSSATATSTPPATATSTATTTATTTSTATATATATSTVTSTDTLTETPTLTPTPTNTRISQGDSCTDTSQCAPGLYCAQGACCNDPCGGPNQSCTVAGRRGECLTITPAPSPALSPTGLLAALATLLAIAAFALVSRRRDVH